MSWIVFRIVVLFSLLVFPVLPGLCECAKVPSRDHGCCHDDTSQDSHENPCPDELHLCILNPQDVELVAQSGFTVPSERDADEDRSLAFLLSPGVSTTPVRVQRLPDLLSNAKDVSTDILLPPVRGPPAHTS